MMDIAKLERFLEYIVTMSFSCDAIQDTQYSLDRGLESYDYEELSA